MGRGRIGPNSGCDEPVDDQQREGMPWRDNPKIEACQRLQRSVEKARKAYRREPTVANEAALRKLITSERQLSDDIGFGINGVPARGPVKMTG